MSEPTHLELCDLTVFSYPRTETTAYPADFDFAGILAQLAPVSALGRRVCDEGVVRPKGGDDKGDHPPITPMRAAAVGELTGDYARVYDYVCAHFLATLMRPCKYVTRTAK